MNNCQRKERYQYIDHIFIKENFDEKLQCHINDNSAYLILRILHGRVSCLDIVNNKRYKFNKNYFITPPVLNNSRKRSQLLEIFTDSEEYSLNELIENFDFHSKKNKVFFTNLEFEILRCLIENEKSNYIVSFLYLYRALEALSYSYPLLFFSFSKDYRGTYDALKKIFTDKNNISELKFFNKFAEQSFSNEDFYNIPIIISYEKEESDPARRTQYHNIINILLGRSNFDINDPIECTFKEFYQLFIEIRNRYFHLLQGSGKANLTGMNLMYPENFFRSIVPLGIKMFTDIYFQLMIHFLSNRAATLIKDH